MSIQTLRARYRPLAVEESSSLHCYEASGGVEAVPLSAISVVKTFDNPGFLRSKAG